MRPHVDRLLHNRIVCLSGHQIWAFINKKSIRYSYFIVLNWQRPPNFAFTASQKGRGMTQGHCTRLGGSQETGKVNLRFKDLTEGQTAVHIKRPVFVPYLRGPAARPVRGPHGDVDAGRGLSVGGVSPLGGGKPGDNQATGETTLPKQQAESGRRRGDLSERHRAQICSCTNNYQREQAVSKNNCALQSHARAISWENALLDKFSW